MDDVGRIRECVCDYGDNSLALCSEKPRKRSSTTHHHNKHIGDKPQHKANHRSHERHRGHAKHWQAAHLLQQVVLVHARQVRVQHHDDDQVEEGHAHSYNNQVNGHVRNHVPDATAIHALQVGLEAAHWRNDHTQQQRLHKANERVHLLDVADAVIAVLCKHLEQDVEQQVAENGEGQVAHRAPPQVNKGKAAAAAGARAGVLLLAPLPLGIRESVRGAAHNVVEQLPKEGHEAQAAAEQVQKQAQAGAGRLLWAGARALWQAGAARRGRHHERRQLLGLLVIAVEGGLNLGAGGGHAEGGAGEAAAGGSIRGLAEAAAECGFHYGTRVYKTGCRKML